MVKNLKILSGILLIAFVTTTLFYPLTIKAQNAGDLGSKIAEKCGISFATDYLAGQLGSLLGISEVPVSDFKFKFQECVRAVVDELVKTALAATKKRLLDALVDDIIRWIQGGGDPRFVTDWEGFLRDAADAGIGDVIRELSPQLCSPFRTQVILSLQTPVFSQRARCTLSQVVSNFEDWLENFESGGWIAYQETWKPANNPWGAIIIAHDEIIKRSAEKQEAARQEAQAGQGFIGVKRCTVWEFRELATGLHIKEVKSPVTGNSYNTGSPRTGNEKPEFPPTGVPADLVQGKYDWRCAKTETVTPGKVAGDITVKAIGSNIDYLINAQDLSTYIAAIADAAINRLLKETTIGLKGLFREEEGARPKSTPTGDVDCSVLTGEARRECYQGTGRSEQQQFQQTKTSLISRITQANNLLNTASQNLSQALAISLGFATKLENLYTCLQAKANAGDSNAAVAALNASSSLKEFLMNTQPTIQLNILRIDQNNTGLRTLTSNLQTQIDQARTLNELTSTSLTQAIINLEIAVNSLKTESQTILAKIQSDLQKAEQDLAACTGS